MTPPVRLVLVGGGVHVATLVEDLVSAWTLPRPLDLRLVARDPGRLDAIAAHVATRVAEDRPDWRVSASVDLAAAAEAADAVVLMVRVGGLGARAADEQFPREFGLVGDEGLGAGGMANALRTVPTVAELGRTLARVAPAALVLNLVAPLPTTTRTLLDAGVRALGLCELPSVVRDRLVGPAGSGPGEDLDAPGADGMCLGGLNHVSWWWSADGTERLGAAARAAGLVDGRTLERYGAVPMPYFYRVLEPGAGAALGIVQPVGRAAELDALSQGALDAMRARPGRPVPELETRATPWFDRAVVPVLTAWFGGPPFRGPLDVPNDQLVAGPAAGVVVEVMGTVTEGRWSTEPATAAPAAVAEFTARMGRAEELVGAVAADGGAPRPSLVEALELVHPDLDVRRRGALADRILQVAGRAA